MGLVGSTCAFCLLSLPLIESQTETGDTSSRHGGVNPILTLFPPDWGISPGSQFRTLDPSFILFCESCRDLDPMGNNTSSEASHKPHKLTKPRVGNVTAPAGLSTSSIYSGSGNGRFSNSYIIGPPMPISPTEPLPAGLMQINPGPSIAKRTPKPMARATRRHSVGRSNASNIESTQPQRPVRRSTLIASNTAISSPIEIHSPTAQAFNNNGSSRPGIGIDRCVNIIIFHPEDKRLSYCSFKVANQGNEQWRAINYSLGPTQAQQPHEDNISRSESLKITQGVTENTWKSSHPHTAPTSPISRANSEVSLYTPMRRRSMIQTPGVATRAEQTATRASAMPSSRHSLPPTPCLSKNPSMESVVTRRMTMPAGLMDLTSIKMSVDTPSEADYRQLGGIKFGSLRITNGAPDLTPFPQDDGKSKSDKDLGYFECKQSTSEKKAFEPGEEEGNRPSQTALVSQNQKATDQKDENMSFATRMRITPCVDSSRLQIVDVKETILSSPSAHAVSSISRRYAKQTRKDVARPGKEGAGGRTILATDMIDIKNGISARANMTKYQLELEHKTVKTLARSDSGFVPSPSSDTSRKALSKADSGYSSNVSLRSLRSLKPEAFDRTRQSFETQSSGTPERRASGKSGTSSTPSMTPQKQHVRSKSELPPPPSRPRENEVPAIPARRSSLSSLAHVAIKRIPTLKRSKSRNAASDETETTSGAHLTETGPIKSNSFTSLSTMRTRSEGFARTTMKPSLPQRQEVLENAVDAERKPRKHKKPSTTVSHRLGPRNQSSKDTLKTILSVGSTDMLQACELTQADGAPTPTTEKKFQSTPPRKRSLRSLSHSFTQATSNLFHSKHNDAPLPPKVPAKNCSSDDRGALKLEAQASPTGHKQRRASHASSGQTRTTAPSDRQMNIGGLKKAHSAERKGPKQLSPLKTQRSAPNFAGQDEWPLSPTVPELSHLIRDKTTPPVSMRTRSSKSLRGTPPSRSWSAPPVDAPARPQAPAMRNRSQERLASRRSSHSSGHSPHGSLSSIMEAQVSSPRPMSPTSHDKTSWHMKPRARPQTATSSRLNQGPNTSASTHGLLRNSRTLPGIAIPYPDIRNKQAPTRHRSMSDVQNTSPTWATKRPSESQLQELRTLTQQQQHQQSYHRLSHRSRRHSRHSSDGSKNGQFSPSHVPPLQTHHTSPTHRGIAI